MMDFILLAAAAGTGVAAMTGPLGSFVVWRKLAYFGDTLAHGALIGAALGLALHIHPQWSVILCSVLLAFALLLLQKRSQVANDTLLGILSHSSLAGGLVLVSQVNDRSVDLYGLLFGDLLTVNGSDVAAVFLIAFVVIGLLVTFWRGLLSTTLDENLAKVEGFATDKLQVLLMLLMALVVAFAMKVVGILLITALLIIPAAAARYLSRSPEAMALGAAIIGIVAVYLGLAASYFWDTPAGPSIVLASSLIFLFCRLSSDLRR